MTHELPLVANRRRAGSSRCRPVLIDSGGRGPDEQQHGEQLASFLVLDDLAPAEARYNCTLPDNLTSVQDVRVGLASVRPAVVLREIGLADNVGDGWVQDQFQLGYIVAPGRTMRAVLHMPRFRTNAQLGVNQRNLAELVRTHFPSTDLGLIDDFWKRTVPLSHRGGVRQLTFTESEAAFRVLRRTVQANSFLRDALERLCATARQLTATPAPRECSNVPPPMETLPAIRQQLPELLRRVLAVVDGLLSGATSSQQTGLRTLRARSVRLVRDVERTLSVAGSPGAEVFGLELSGTTMQIDGSDLVVLFETLTQMHDSLVYGGNIEASPPVDGHPFGKVVLGEGEERVLDPQVRNLFESSAAVQPVVTIDTGWLGVGHTDELMTFLRDRGTGGHVILRASPEVATALMDEAGNLYRSGLPVWHPDRSSPWRPLTIARHRMHQGSHPVTRLFRGKLWLHAQPQLPPTAEGEEEVSRQEAQDPGEVLLPPQIYLRQVDWYSGLLSDSLAPFFPDSREDVHYYRAALTMWDFEFFEGATNEVIVEEKLGALDEILAREFPRLSIRRAPMVFDRMPLLDEAPRIAGSTAAFTPNPVNLQFVNGTALVPNPFGPRMRPADAATVVTTVLRDQGLGGVASRVSARYFQRQRLDITEVWLNPALHDGRVTTPFRSAADLAEEFADGFPGIARDEVERRIRRANRTAFDAFGGLRDGWRKIRIPEQTVDLFQAYAHVLLDALGVRPHWVDSWFYHLRVGEIHCGTNVLRAVPRVRTPWWNRIPSPSSTAPRP